MMHQMLLRIYVMYYGNKLDYFQHMHIKGTIVGWQLAKTDCITQKMQELTGQVYHTSSVHTVSQTCKR
jgi:hypothetical protein